MSHTPGWANVSSLVLRLALFAGVAVCAQLAGPAWAGVVYVKADATGANNGHSWADAYTDLQAALAAVEWGDEIWVVRGTYKPTSGTDRAVSFVLKAGVGLYGGFAGAESERNQRDWKANATILSDDIGILGSTADNSHHLVIGAYLTVLDGFTITGGNANGSGSLIQGGGIYNEGISLTVTNCTFSGNTASGGGMSHCGIRWTWSDQSSNETGFKVWADPGCAAPTTLRAITAANVTSWTMSALQPNTQYAFQVAATNTYADSAKTANYTTWTMAAVPAAPTVDNPTVAALDLAVGDGDGNPAGTQYAIRISPAVYGNAWVRRDGTLGAAEDWATAAIWATTTVTGLAEGTVYTFTVKARNGAGVETAMGTSASARTTYAPCTLTYNAGTGGSITGTTPLTLDYGADGSEVTALPNADYRFVRWSDGVMTASRTDTNVTADINVNAVFARLTLVKDWSLYE